jgi:hypothetical protein
MTTFTFDSNCIIALERNEPVSQAVRALINAHDQGSADVAVVAISASENPRGQLEPQSFGEFQRRLSGVGLGQLEILRPIGYFDITFWDWCLWSGEEEQALERQIHEILFPTVHFLWPAFCEATGIDPNESTRNTRWRNCKCDVLALWSHIHVGRDVFVTNDDNFHAVTKKPGLIALGAGRIEKPEVAVTLI